mmetsp:Transcript_28710/g.49016  ORF Transcript_28710/g.49016 Transcript_28710/m.49016 type:complete len:219 (-) Transcript_28710:158-814(-)
MPVPADDDPPVAAESAPAADAVVLRPHRLRVVGDACARRLFDTNGHGAVRVVHAARPSPRLSRTGAERVLHPVRYRARGAVRVVARAHCGGLEAFERGPLGQQRLECLVHGFRGVGLVGDHDNLAVRVASAAGVVVRAGRARRGVAGRAHGVRYHPEQGLRAARSAQLVVSLLQHGVGRIDPGACRRGAAELLVRAVESASHGLGVVTEEVRGIAAGG